MRGQYVIDETESRYFINASNYKLMIYYDFDLVSLNRFLLSNRMSLAMVRPHILSLCA